MRTDNRRYIHPTFRKKCCYVLKLIQQQVHKQLPMSSVFTTVWYGICYVSRCFILFIPVQCRPWDQMTIHLVLSLYSSLQQTNEDIQFPDCAVYRWVSIYLGRYGQVNLHEWADENPCSTLVHGHQRRFAVNIWAGIVCDYLLGPYTLPPWLRWPLYRMFSEVHLLRLLEEVPLGIRRRM